MNIKNVILCVVIIVVQTNGLMQLRTSLASSDNPLLAKILQSIDAATSDEHLFEVTLKLLKSLCVCMRNTLKEKQDRFNSDKHFIGLSESVNTEGKVIDIYKKIYNNTCFNLKEDLSKSNNKSRESWNHSNCGKAHNSSNTEKDEDTLRIKKKLKNKLDHILYRALVQTRPYHKYNIKKYNLFGKAKPGVKSSSKHTLIVILTLHPAQKDLRKYNVLEEDLYKILHKNSTIEIDIIDTKYDQKEQESEEVPKSENYPDCHLQSIYTYLAESEKKNLTKVIRFLRKHDTIKIYIEVFTGRNHSDFTNMCCENGTLTTLCKKDLVESLASPEEYESFKKVDKVKSSLLQNRFQNTISKLKNWVDKLDNKQLSNTTKQFEKHSSFVPTKSRIKYKTTQNVQSSSKESSSGIDRLGFKGNNIPTFVENLTHPFKLHDVSRAIILLNDFVSKQTTTTNEIGPSAEKRQEFPQENHSIKIPEVYFTERKTQTEKISIAGVTDALHVTNKTIYNAFKKYESNLVSREDIDLNSTNMDDKYPITTLKASKNTSKQNAFLDVLSTDMNNEVKHDRVEFLSTTDYDLIAKTSYDKKAILSKFSLLNNMKSNISQNLEKKVYPPNKWENNHINRTKNENESTPLIPKWREIPLIITAKVRKYTPNTTPKSFHWLEVLNFSINNISKIMPTPTQKRNDFKLENKGALINHNTIGKTMPDSNIRVYGLSLVSSDENKRLYISVSKSSLSDMIQRDPMKMKHNISTTAQNSIQLPDFSQANNHEPMFTYTLGKKDTNGLLKINKALQTTAYTHDPYSPNTTNTKSSDTDTKQSANLITKEIQEKYFDPSTTENIKQSNVIVTNIIEMKKKTTRIKPKKLSTKAPIPTLSGQELPVEKNTVSLFYDLILSNKTTSLSSKNNGEQLKAQIRTTKELENSIAEDTIENVIKNPYIYQKGKSPSITVNKTKSISNLEKNVPLWNMNTSVNEMGNVKTHLIILPSTANEQLSLAPGNTLQAALQVKNKRNDGLNGNEKRNNYYNTNKENQIHEIKTTKQTFLPENTIRVLHNLTQDFAKEFTKNHRQYENPNDISSSTITLRIYGDKTVINNTENNEKQISVSDQHNRTDFANCSMKSTTFKTVQPIKKSVGVPYYSNNTELPEFTTTEEIHDKIGNNSIVLEIFSKIHENVITGPKNEKDINDSLVKATVYNSTYTMLGESKTKMTITHEETEKSSYNLFTIIDIGNSKSDIYATTVKMNNNYTSKSYMNNIGLNHAYTKYDNKFKGLENNNQKTKMKETDTYKITTSTFHTAIQDSTLDKKGVSNKKYTPEEKKSDSSIFTASSGINYITTDLTLQKNGRVLQTDSTKSQKYNKPPGNITKDIILSGKIQNKSHETVTLVDSIPPTEFVTYLINITTENYTKLTNRIPFTSLAMTSALVKDEVIEIQLTQNPLNLQNNYMADQIVLPVAIDTTYPISEEPYRTKEFKNYVRNIALPIVLHESRIKTRHTNTQNTITDRNSSTSTEATTQPYTINKVLNMTSISNVIKSNYTKMKDNSNDNPPNQNNSLFTDVDTSQSNAKIMATGTFQDSNTYYTIQPNTSKISQFTSVNTKENLTKGIKTQLINPEYYNSTNSVYNSNHVEISVDRNNVREIEANPTTQQKNYIDIPEVTMPNMVLETNSKTVYTNVDSSTSQKDIYNKSEMQVQLQTVVYTMAGKSNTLKGTGSKPKEHNHITTNSAIPEEENTILQQLQETITTGIESRKETILDINNTMINSLPVTNGTVIEKQNNLKNNLCKITTAPNNQLFLNNSIHNTEHKQIMHDKKFTGFASGIATIKYGLPPRVILQKSNQFHSEETKNILHYTTPYVKIGDIIKPKTTFITKSDDEVSLKRNVTRSLLNPLHHEEIIKNKTEDIGIMTISIGGNKMLELDNTTKSKDIVSNTNYKSKIFQTLFTDNTKNLNLKKNNPYFNTMDNNLKYTLLYSSNTRTLPIKTFKLKETVNPISEITNTEIAVTNLKSSTRTKNNLLSPYTVPENSLLPPPKSVVITEKNRILHNNTTKNQNVVASVTVSKSTNKIKRNIHNAVTVLNEKLTEPLTTKNTLKLLTTSILPTDYVTNRTLALPDVKTAGIENHSVVNKNQNIVVSMTVTKSTNKITRTLHNAVTEPFPTIDPSKLLTTAILPKNYVTFTTPPLEVLNATDFKNLTSVTQNAIASVTVSNSTNEITRNIHIGVKVWNETLPESLTRKDTLKLSTTSILPTHYVTNTTLALVVLKTGDTENYSSVTRNQNTVPSETVLNRTNKISNSHNTVTVLNETLTEPLPTKDHLKSLTPSTLPINYVTNTIPDLAVLKFIDFENHTFVTQNSDVLVTVSNITNKITTNLHNATIVLKETLNEPMPIKDFLKILTNSMLSTNYVTNTTPALAFLKATDVVTHNSVTKNKNIVATVTVSKSRNKITSNLHNAVTVLNATSTEPSSTKDLSKLLTTTFTTNYGNTTPALAANQLNSFTLINSKTSEIFVTKQKRNVSSPVQKKMQVFLAKNKNAIEILKVVGKDSFSGHGYLKLNFTKPVVENHTTYDIKNKITETTSLTNISTSPLEENKVLIELYNTTKSERIVPYTGSKTENFEVSIIKDTYQESKINKSNFNTMYDIVKYTLPLKILPKQYFQLKETDNIITNPTYKTANNDKTPTNFVNYSTKNNLLQLSKYFAITESVTTFRTNIISAEHKDYFSTIPFSNSTNNQETHIPRNFNKSSTKILPTKDPLKLLTTSVFTKNGAINTVPPSEFIKTSVSENDSSITATAVTTSSSNILNTTEKMELNVPKPKQDTNSLVPINMNKFQVFSDENKKEIRRLNVTKDRTHFNGFTSITTTPNYDNMNLNYTKFQLENHIMEHIVTNVKDEKPATMTSHNIMKSPIIKKNQVTKYNFNSAKNNLKYTIPHATSALSSYHTLKETGNINPTFKATAGIPLTNVINLSIKNMKQPSYIVTENSLQLPPTRFAKRKNTLAWHTNIATTKYKDVISPITFSNGPNKISRSSQTPFTISNETMTATIQTEDHLNLLQTLVLSTNYVTNKKPSMVATKTARFEKYSSSTRKLSTPTLFVTRKHHFFVIKQRENANSSVPLNMLSDKVEFSNGNKKKLEIRNVLTEDKYNFSGITTIKTKPYHHIKFNFTKPTLENYTTYFDIANVKNETTEMTTFPIITTSPHFKIFQGLLTKNIKDLQLKQNYSISNTMKKSIKNKKMLSHTTRALPTISLKLKQTDNLAIKTTFKGSNIEIPLNYLVYPGPKNKTQPYLITIDTSLPTIHVAIRTKSPTWHTNIATVEHKDNIPSIAISNNANIVTRHSNQTNINVNKSTTEILPTENPVILLVNNNYVTHTESALAVLTAVTNTRTPIFNTTNKIESFLAKLKQNTSSAVTINMRNNNNSRQSFDRNKKKVETLKELTTIKYNFNGTTMPCHNNLHLNFTKPTEKNNILYIDVKNETIETITLPKITTPSIVENSHERMKKVKILEPQYNKSNFNTSGISFKHTLPYYNSKALIAESLKLKDTVNIIYNVTRTVTKTEIPLTSLVNLSSKNKVQPSFIGTENSFNAKHVARRKTTPTWHSNIARTEYLPVTFLKSNDKLTSYSNNSFTILTETLTEAVPKANYIISNVTQTVTNTEIPFLNSVNISLTNKLQQYFMANENSLPAKHDATGKTTPTGHTDIETAKNRDNISSIAISKSVNKVTRHSNQTVITLNKSTAEILPTENPVTLMTTSILTNNYVSYTSSLPIVGSTNKIEIFQAKPNHNTNSAVTINMRNSNNSQESFDRNTKKLKILKVLTADKFYFGGTTLPYHNHLYLKLTKSTEENIFISNDEKNEKIEIITLPNSVSTQSIVKHSQRSVKDTEAKSHVTRKVTNTEIPLTSLVNLSPKNKLQPSFRVNENGLPTKHVATRITTPTWQTNISMSEHKDVISPVAFSKSTVKIKRNSNKTTAVFKTKNAEISIIDQDQKLKQSISEKIKQNNSELTTADSRLKYTIPYTTNTFSKKSLKMQGAVSINPTPKLTNIVLPFINQVNLVTKHNLWPPYTNGWWRKHQDDTSAIFSLSTNKNPFTLLGFVVPKTTTFENYSTITVSTTKPISTLFNTTEKSKLYLTKPKQNDIITNNWFTSPAAVNMQSNMLNKFNDVYKKKLEISDVNSHFNGTIPYFISSSSNYTKLVPKNNMNGINNFKNEATEILNSQQITKLSRQPYEVETKHFYYSTLMKVQPQTSFDQYLSTKSVKPLLLDKKISNFSSQSEMPGCDFNVLKVLNTDIDYRLNTNLLTDLTDKQSNKKKKNCSSFSPTNPATPITSKDLTTTNSDTFKLNIRVGIEKDKDQVKFSLISIDNKPEEISQFSKLKTSSVSQGDIITSIGDINETLLLNMSKRTNPKIVMSASSNQSANSQQIQNKYPQNILRDKKQQNITDLFFTTNNNNTLMMISKYKKVKKASAKTDTFDKQEREAVNITWKQSRNDNYNTPKTVNFNKTTEDPSNYVNKTFDMKNIDPPRANTVVETTISSAVTTAFKKRDHKDNKRNELLSKKRQKLTNASQRMGNIPNVLEKLYKNKKFLTNKQTKADKILIIKQILTDSQKPFRHNNSQKKAASEIPANESDRDKLSNILGRFKTQIEKPTSKSNLPAKPSVINELSFVKDKQQRIVTNTTVGTLDSITSYSTQPIQITEELGIPLANLHRSKIYGTEQYPAPNQDQIPNSVTKNLLLDKTKLQDKIHYITINIDIPYLTLRNLNTKDKYNNMLNKVQANAPTTEEVNVLKSATVAREEIINIHFPVTKSTSILTTLFNSTAPMNSKLPISTETGKKIKTFQDTISEMPSKITLNSPKLNRYLKLYNNSLNANSNKQLVKTDHANVYNYSMVNSHVEYRLLNLFSTSTTTIKDLISTKSSSDDTLASYTLNYNHNTKKKLILNNKKSSTTSGKTIIGQPTNNKNSTKITLGNDFPYRDSDSTITDTNTFTKYENQLVTKNSSFMKENTSIQQHLDVKKITKFIFPALLTTKQFLTQPRQTPNNNNPDNYLVPSPYSESKHSNKLQVFSEGNTKALEIASTQSVDNNNFKHTTTMTTLPYYDRMNINLIKPAFERTTRPPYTKNTNRSNYSTIKNYITTPVVKIEQYGHFSVKSYTSHIMNNSKPHLTDMNKILSPKHFKEKSEAVATSKIINNDKKLSILTNNLNSDLSSTLLFTTMKHQTWHNNSSSPNSSFNPTNIVSKPELNIINNTLTDTFNYMTFPILNTGSIKISNAVINVKALKTETKTESGKLIDSKLTDNKKVSPLKPKSHTISQWTNDNTSASTKVIEDISEPYYTTNNQMNLTSHIKSTNFNSNHRLVTTNREKSEITFVTPVINIIHNLNIRRNYNTSPLVTNDTFNNINLPNLNNIDNSLTNAINRKFNITITDNTSNNDNLNNYQKITLILSNNRVQRTNKTLTKPNINQNIVSSNSRLQLQNTSNEYSTITFSDHPNPATFNISSVSQSLLNNTDVKFETPTSRSYKQEIIILTSPQSHTATITRSPDLVITFKYKPTATDVVQNNMKTDRERHNLVKIRNTKIHNDYLTGKHKVMVMNITAFNSEKPTLTTPVKRSTVQNQTHKPISSNGAVVTTISDIGSNYTQSVQTQHLSSVSKEGNTNNHIINNTESTLMKYITIPVTKSLTQRTQESTQTETLEFVTPALTPSTEITSQFHISPRIDILKNSIVSNIHILSPQSSKVILNRYTKRKADGKTTIINSQIKSIQLNNRIKAIKQIKEKPYPNEVSLAPFWRKPKFNIDNNSIFEINSKLTNMMAKIKSNTLNNNKSKTFINKMQKQLSLKDNSILYAKQNQIVASTRKYIDEKIKFSRALNEDNQMTPTYNSESNKIAHTKPINFIDTNLKEKTSIDIYSSRINRHHNKILPKRKVIKTVKYNTYQPVINDDLYNLKHNSQKTTSPLPRPNIPCAVLKTIRHKFNSSFEFLQVLKSANCSLENLTIHYNAKKITNSSIKANVHKKIKISTHLSKNKQLNVKISNKMFTKLVSKETLFKPFEKTKLFPVKTMMVKSPKRPSGLVRRINIGNRKQIMSMNTHDFFSQHHQLETPSQDRYRHMLQKQYFRSITPLPRHHSLIPRFEAFEISAPKLNNPKSYFLRAQNSEVVLPDTYNPHSNKIPNWQQNIGELHAALENNPFHLLHRQMKMITNDVLSRPFEQVKQEWRPKKFEWKSGSNNMKLWGPFETMQVTRTPHYYDSNPQPLTPFPDKLILLQSKYRPYPAVINPTPKLAPTLRRPSRNRRTIFFLSPTVTNWWLDDMYLKVRLPLPINSNPGMVFPRRHFAKMEEVADLGALFIDDILDYKEMLDRGELPLERATSREKGQPLCMEQFYRLLGVCRIPEVGKDRLELPQFNGNAEEQEELIVVACRNYFYPIPVKATDRGRLTPGEIQAQLLHAMVDAAGAPPAPRVGLLTSMSRDQWARAREHLIKDEMNRMNLELISRALCILCLDEAGGDRADLDPETNAMLRAMHGAGTQHHSANRWFDKTVQLIISSDGTVGMCYEHSAAEGVAVVRLAERALARAEVADRPAPPPALLPAPQAMKWNIVPDIHRNIEQAARDLDRAISDLDFKIYTYSGYGREFMKSCRTSPDVYIQLAIQYSYYKMYGYLVTTYESASLRRFRQGRVDNIRSAHGAALAWAAAMCTAETSPLNDGTDEGQKKVSFNLYGEQKKLELFEEAARKQTSIMESNILGKGIDNHLLGLREMARETLGELPPVFSDATYKQMIEFKMSTSQVTTTTDGTYMGYGAVCPDGYGCCYNPKKDSIIFCISSFTSSSITNTEAYRQSLEEALDSMKLMFQARQVQN